MISAPGDLDVPYQADPEPPLGSVFDAWRDLGFDAAACPVRNVLSVLRPLAALIGWAEDSYPAIRAARQRFDAATKEL